MKKNIITLLVLTLSVGAFAQNSIGVGIGTKKPSQSAILDVKASDKGVLIPRMALISLNTFHLQGSGTTPETQKAAGALNEGMLIYNTQNTESIPSGFYYWTNSVNGGQWELVTSQSVTKEIVDRITTIEENVGVGGNTNGGGTVIYRPGTPGAPGAPGAPGKIVYVEKDPTTGTTEEQVIDVADLIRGSETETFFRVVGKDENGVEKKTLVYFSEKAISTWKAIAGNEKKDPKAEMKDTDAGSDAVIDVSSVVTNNFNEIVSKTETKEILEKIIQGAPGNVSIVEVPVKGSTTGETKLEIHIGNGKEVSDTEPGYVVFDLNKLETKTSFAKTTGMGAAEEAKKGDVTTEPTADQIKEKGKVIYTYLGEDKETPYYIDITADMLTVLKNNTTVRDQIIKVINSPGEGEGPHIPGGDGGVTNPTNPTNPTDPAEIAKSYGNVYYGPENGKDGPAVLYSIDKDGVKHYIDISANIIKEITNNTDVVEKIKEITTVRVEAGKPGEVVETGNEIGGKKVYKGLANVKVADDFGYDSTFTGNITITTANVNFGRLLSVIVLDANGQVVIDTATDVTKGNNGFKFHFGVGNMYAPIANGDYEVIYEFIAE